MTVYLRWWVSEPPPSETCWIREFQGFSGKGVRILSKRQEDQSCLDRNAAVIFLFQVLRQALFIPVMAPRLAHPHTMQQDIFRHASISRTYPPIFSESCDQQLTDFDLEWFRWQEGTSVPRHLAKLDKFTKKWAGLPNWVQQHWFQLLKTLTTWSYSFVSHHKTLDIRIVPK